MTTTKTINMEKTAEEILNKKAPVFQQDRDQTLKSLVIEAMEAYANQYRSIPKEQEQEIANLKFSLDQQVRQFNFEMKGKKEQEQEIERLKAENEAHKIYINKLHGDKADSSLRIRELEARQSCKLE